MKNLHRYTAALVVLGLLVLAGWGLSVAGAQTPQSRQEAGTPADQAAPSPSHLERILAEGVIRVGTTGDYRPFSYLNPETGQYEGFDIDAAHLLAQELGVQVRFVETSWPTLMDDLLQDKFDIAMGGITRTLEREKRAHLSLPYLDFGKAALIRRADQDKFQSLEDFDQPHVRVGVNPGGTNERFVREHIKNAQVIVIQNNLAIPGMVASGQVDVMFTDSVEALLYAREDPRLLAAFTEDTFTRSQMGYLMHQEDFTFHNWVNLWIQEMELRGDFQKLQEKWF